MTPYEVASENGTAKALRLRVELKWLRARYDCGAISSAVFDVVKRLECDIAWAEHEDRRDQR
jgi:hypothetical protein